MIDTVTLMQNYTMIIGWKDLTSEERRQDEIVLGKVEGESVYVQLAYSVAINKDLSWRVSCRGQDIQSSMLSYLSSRNSSLSDAKKLLEIIDGSKVCAGNSEAKYRPLLESRKEIFKDASGM